MEKHKVFVGQEVPESGLTYLRDKGYDVVQCNSNDFTVWEKEIGDASAMLTRSSVGCPGFV